MLAPKTFRCGPVYKAVWRIWLPEARGERDEPDPREKDKRLMSVPALVGELRLKHGVELNYPGWTEFAASVANSEIASVLGRFTSLHCRLRNLLPGLAESLRLLAARSLRHSPKSEYFAANSHRGGK